MYGPETAEAADYPSEPMREDPRRDREVAAKLRQRDSSRAPIEAALDRADEQSVRVLELVENLTSRLSPILGPDRPEPALGEVRSGDDTSALAGRLDLLADRLNEAAAALLRTTRRIEL